MLQIKALSGSIIAEFDEDEISAFAQDDQIVTELQIMKTYE